MDRQEYIGLLRKEDYYSIIYNFYKENNKKEEYDFTYSAFLESFTRWVNRGVIDINYILNKMVEGYNKKFTIVTILNKEKQIIGYN